MMKSVRVASPSQETREPYMTPHILLGHLSMMRMALKVMARLFILLMEIGRMWL